MEQQPKKIIITSQHRVQPGCENNKLKIELSINIDCRNESEESLSVCVVIRL